MPLMPRRYVLAPNLPVNKGGDLFSKFDRPRHPGQPGKRAGVVRPIAELLREILKIRRRATRKRKCIYLSNDALRAQRIFGVG